MKKTLLTLAATLVLPTIASAHCGDCKADAAAKPKCEQQKCDKPKCDKPKCDKAKCSDKECQKKCEEYFNNAFKEHDKDKDGKLDHVEFKALVKATLAKKCGKSCSSKNCEPKADEEGKQ